MHHPKFQNCNAIDYFSGLYFSAIVSLNALARKSITAEEMDQADDELRETIRHIWPLQAKKMLDLLVPQSDCLNQGKLTVGKLYAGLLILESWRNTRFGQIDSGLPVSKVSFKHTLIPKLIHSWTDLVSFGVVAGNTYLLIKIIITNSPINPKFNFRSI